MIKCDPIIGVLNVEKSSEWYQKLLDCNSSHGGNAFEILTDNNGEIFLCLHKWAEHEHPTLSDPTIQPGNGLVLYLIVEDLNKVWANAQELNTKIEESPQINPSSGKEQFCLRDLEPFPSRSYA